MLSDGKSSPEHFLSYNTGHSDSEAPPSDPDAFRRALINSRRDSGQLPQLDQSNWQAPYDAAADIRRDLQMAVPPTTPLEDSSR